MKELLLKAGLKMEQKFIEIKEIQAQIYKATEELTDEQLDKILEDPELVELNRRVKGLIEEIWN